MDEGDVLLVLDGVGLQAHGAGDIMDLNLTACVHECSYKYTATTYRSV